MSHLYNIYHKLVLVTPAKWYSCIIFILWSLAIDTLYHKPSRVLRSGYVILEFTFDTFRPLLSSCFKQSYVRSGGSLKFNDVAGAGDDPGVT